MIQLRFVMRRMIVAVAVLGLAFGFDRWLVRGDKPPEYHIVFYEGLIVLVAISLAWLSRRSYFLVPCGILIGMALAAFQHGVYYGVLHDEAAGQDTGMLMGFGMVAAVVPGVPLGAVLGAGLLLLRRTPAGTPRRVSEVKGGVRSSPPSVSRARSHRW